MVLILKDFITLTQSRHGAEDTMSILLLDTRTMYKLILPEIFLLRQLHHITPQQ